MSKRNYTAAITTTTLSATINASATSMVLADVSKMPAAPFTAAIEPGVSARQEVVLVTAVNVGTKTLTMTRGYDNTAAVSHSAGVTVEHSVSALDFSEANILASGGGFSVHWATNAPSYVVGGFTDWGVNFPAFTYMIPPSGRFLVVVQANIGNTNTDTSTNWCSYKINGAGIVAPASGAPQTVYIGPDGQTYSASGTGRHEATQAYWGGRATGGHSELVFSCWPWYFPNNIGETLTFTPQYQISSGDAGTAVWGGSFIFLIPV